MKSKKINAMKETLLALKLDVDILNSLTKKETIKMFNTMMLLKRISDNI